MRKQLGKGEEEPYAAKQSTWNTCLPLASLRNKKAAFTWLRNWRQSIENLSTLTGLGLRCSQRSDLAVNLDFLAVCIFYFDISFVALCFSR